jgi:DnaJ-class molecular chaperone
MVKPNETIYDSQGNEYTGEIPTELNWRNGRATLTKQIKCTRCGGKGTMPYSVWAGRCFKCGGSGINPTLGKVVRNAWVFTIDKPYISQSGNNYWTGENVS